MKREAGRLRWFLCILIITIGILVVGGIGEGQKIFAAYYSITDLGTFGSDYSFAFNINNAGKVVGYTSRGAYIWDKNKGIRYLPLIEAYGINNRGQVVGTNMTEPFNPVLWDKGKLTVLIGSNGSANDINDSGQVVGFTNAFGGNAHPYYWDKKSGMLDLGIFGGTDGEATAINNSGYVVGWSDVPESEGDGVAFIWDKKSGIKKLGTLGGDWSAADDINNLGMVVGLSRIDPNDPELAHAFIWEKGIMTDLGTLGGDYSAASGINDFDEIVGISLDTYDIIRPVIWEDGQITDLYTLIVGNPIFDFLFPAAINNAGQIVGFGLIGGEAHAFLMTPIHKSHHVVKPHHFNKSHHVDKPHHFNKPHHVDKAHHFNKFYHFNKFHHAAPLKEWVGGIGGFWEDED